MRIRLLALGLMLGLTQLRAPAQIVPITVTNQMAINFSGGAWGIPGDIFAAVFPGKGTITLTAEDGVAGPADFFSMMLKGYTNATNLYITFDDAFNDTLVLIDHNPALSTTGRSGTFTNAIGTGLYHDVNHVSIGYTFNCIDNFQCYTGAGTPIPLQFESSFKTTGGSITVTFLTENGVPGVLHPKPKVVTVNTTGATLGEQDGKGTAFTNVGATMTTNNSSNSGSGGNALPHRLTIPAASSSGGPDGSLTIPATYPFENSNYSASVSCANLPTGCWISIPSPTGAVPADTSASIAANLDFENLPPGVYPANIAVTLTPTDASATPVSQNTPATLIVNNAPSLYISETGVPLQVAVGGAQVLHTIALGGSATVSFQASASTLAGGNWLSVVPASGTVSVTANTTLGIVANPAGLAAGTYFGRVDINAPGTVTPWQPVEVVLTIAADGAAPILSPTGLIFVTPQGKNPTSQTIGLSTFSSQAISISPGTEEDNLGSWLKVSASSTSLQAGAPVKQTVSINTAGLTPGVYTGNVIEPASAVNYPVPVVLIVTPASGTCTPTQVIPVVTSLSSSFEIPAGLPVSFATQVVDDCGNAMTDGVVQVSFSSGDSPVILAPVGGGEWSGTWLPHGATDGSTSITVSAQSSAGLGGSNSVSGTVDANTTIPVVTPGGIVSAANPLSVAPLAPGQFISIYGSNLAPTNASSPSLPYLTTLAGTQVLLGGQPLPLQFVSPGLINAVVPFETPVNGTQELLISQSGMYSLPETVVVATASPAIFTQSETGQGAGVIVVYSGNGSVFETSPSQTASQGDLLLIYCAGLGPVSPAVADGVAASPTTLSDTVNPVTVTIGGQPANVSFAGLAPYYAGVYQVNAIVPAGVTPGENVPVVVTIAGFQSSAATVSIR